MYRVKIFAFPACTGICIACFSARERLVAKIRIESRPCESICIETICDMWAQYIEHCQEFKTKHYSEIEPCKRKKILNLKPGSAFLGVA